MELKDRALDVIATMSHFHNIDGKIEDFEDKVFTISHAFDCTTQCKQHARNEIAETIRAFRQMRYEYYYIKKKNKS